MGSEILVSEEHYLNLINDQLLLQILIRMGVDNWDGYDEAMSAFNENYIDSIDSE